MRRKLVVFGARQMAEVCAHYFDRDRAYEVVAFTVDGAYIEQSRMMGRPVVPAEEVVRAYPPSSHEMFVAVSYRQMNQVRKRKYVHARALGYRLAHYVSARAYTPEGFTPGDNSFVMEGAIVQPFASIGSNSFIWTGSHVGHHSRIGDHCFVAPRAAISGNVTVRDECFIGINATLRDGITIAPRCLIGAGAVVTSDTRPDGVYAAESAAVRRAPSFRVKP